MYTRGLLLQSFRWLPIVLICLIQPIYSQSNCGSLSSTVTVDSQADATAIANCTVYQGSIALAGDTSGTINFDGVQEILGNLIVESVEELTTLSSDSLQKIGGNFTMSNNTLLSTLSFPQLTTVNTISFEALPAVNEFTFTSGLSSVSNVIISNTFLSTLAGINIVNADNVNINNNNRLKNVSLPLQTARLAITIEANGNAADVTLPDLTSAGSITLRNISSISLPALTLLSGDLLLVDTYITEFAVDELSVTQALTMLDNRYLNETSFQALLSAASINIGNNTRLSSMIFEKLGSVGDISIGGNFTSIDMPVLTSTNGTFNLSSTNPNFNCSTFDADKTKSVIKGSYTCLGTHQAAITSSTPGSGSGISTLTAKPSSGLSGGAKAGIAVGCVVLALAIIAGILFFVRGRKQKGKKDYSVPEPAMIGTDGKAEMMNHEVQRKELPTGEEAHELEEERRVIEIGDNEPEVTYELSGEPTVPRSRGGVKEPSSF